MTVPESRFHRQKHSEEGRGVGGDAGSLLPALPAAEAPAAVAGGGAGAVGASLSATADQPGPVSGACEGWTARSVFLSACMGVWVWV
eukprot:COSAG03_NODE_297_length_9244_cov_14.706397_11_plen_87_part_00